MSNETTGNKTTGRLALVTGGSMGLGLELTRELAGRGWQVITDARHAERFKETELPHSVTVLIGDVTDPAHREELAAEVAGRGRLDLLVHNASTLGPLPMRPLVETDAQGLREVWETNVVAPLALTSRLLDWVRAVDGTVLSVSSDAAVQHYETWGPYGASKAALDHVTLTLAAETGLRAYAVDPGDMHTAMHRDAFPGEDISDRPLPETVVPRLLALVEARPDSGRYRAEEFG